MHSHKFRQNSFHRQNGGEAGGVFADLTISLKVNECEDMREYCLSEECFYSACSWLIVKKKGWLLTLGYGLLTLGKKVRVKS